jgi:hypothetical protein
VLRALLAGLLLLPLVCLAGSVAVCDGVVSNVGPDAGGLYSTSCSVAWRVIDEPVGSWLATLTIADAGSLAVCALLLWAVAWLYRQLRAAMF